MTQLIITTVFCFHPCAGVCFWLFKIPVQTRFEGVKGDTFPSVCIAGEEFVVIREQVLLCLSFGLNYYD